MKIVKNLTIANIRKIEGFIRRQDLDFADDGNYFRGFSYKGMPITTLRTDNTTYLCVRVDYLENEFTYKEWMQTEEYKLCDKFNGVSEFDIDELLEDIETILTKVTEMNENAMNEEIDMTEVKIALANEIEHAEQVVENFKNNFKWYDAEHYELKTLVAYLKSQEQKIKTAKGMDVDATSIRQKKEMVQRLNDYGYVMINKNGFYLSEMTKAITTC